MLQGIYVLTDSQCVPHSQWPDRVEQIIRGGANIIQLRDKQLSDNDLLNVAAAIFEICQHHNVPLIINDRVSLAKKLKADGVHIGKEDQHIHAAREYLGKQFVIGVSCYRNLQSAAQAQHRGADYVAFGSVFPSSTKPNAQRCSLDTLRKAKNILHLPVCAIGGIELKNIKPVITTGVDMIAVSQAIFNAKHPQQAATNLSQTYIMQHSTHHS